MNDIASTAIGVVVGIAGGLWLLLNLVSMRDSLRRGRTALVTQIGALLTLPMFEGGGTWVGTKLLRGIITQEATVFYLVSSVLMIIAINALPCYRLILWAAENMER